MRELHFMHLRIRRWVLWWFYIGVIGGVFAISIILADRLTPPQEKLFLLIGVAHWLLGGVVCWAFESVQVEPKGPPAPSQKSADWRPGTSWHSASEFLLPGGRRSLLPWRH